MKRVLISGLLVLLAVAGPAWAGKTDKKQSEKGPAAAKVQEEGSAGLYKYLPEELGQPAAFTQADLLALKLTAYNSRSQGLSAKLISNSIQAFAWPDSLVLNCYLELQEKEKQNYTGGGKFNYPQAELQPMMQDGVDFISRIAHLYFTGLDDTHVVINLYMKGWLIGTCSGSQLKVLATGK